MSETTAGREPIQLVEIRQPFCANTYGTAPCTASGPAALKCFNTRSTCQDTANYSGSSLSLFFSSGHVSEQGIVGATYIIPSLVSVSTSPTRINLAAADSDAQGLGNRALCTLTFLDHIHTDRVVDPYIDTRGYSGLSRGSFWSKWMARNRYRQNIEIVVYEGYAGQTLSEMSRRLFFFDSIQGPDDGGNISITGKDVLARLEARKAQAPISSPGVLFADVTDAATSFSVAGALIGDYPATGTLRIDNEVMTYTSRVLNGTNIDFSGVTRGTDDSTAAAHTVNTQVQDCLRISNMRIDDTLSLLQQTYGGIHAQYLDLAGWRVEIDSYMSFWRLNALITSPTPVVELVSAIQEQTLVNCWWDEKAAQVKMKAVRGIDVAPRILTAENNIISGTFVLREEPAERVSQVWVYYDRRDKTTDATEETNYKSASIFANLEEEALYDELSVRKIFATFLAAGSLANTTASKIISRYVRVPASCTFRLDAKDRDIWLGDVVQISHPNDVDIYGNRQLRYWTIISAEEVEHGDQIEYNASDTSLFGKIAFVMAGGASDYPGAANVPFKNAYIGNAEGLLSDGSPCAKVT